MPLKHPAAKTTPAKTRRSAAVPATSGAHLLQDTLTAKTSNDRARPAQRRFQRSYYKLDVRADGFDPWDYTAQPVRAHEPETAPVHRLGPPSAAATRLPTAAESALAEHRKRGEIARAQVTWRGDSRFPWQVHDGGGMRPKGFGTTRFSASLHQSAPSTHQNVLSTSTDPATAAHYATAWGREDQRYRVPDREHGRRYTPFGSKHAVLMDLMVNKADLGRQAERGDAQPKLSWIKDSGYQHALWAEQGVDLMAMGHSQARGTVGSHFADKYAWEREIAVLDGLDPHHMLASRRIDKLDTGAAERRATREMYVDRHLMLGKTHNANGDDAVLNKVLKGLTGLADKDLQASIIRTREAVKNAAARAIQRAWRLRKAQS